MRLHAWSTQPRSRVCARCGAVRRVCFWQLQVLSLSLSLAREWRISRYWLSRDPRTVVWTPISCVVLPRHLGQRRRWSRVLFCCRWMIFLGELSRPLLRIRCGGKSLASACVEYCLQIQIIYDVVRIFVLCCDLRKMNYNLGHRTGDKYSVYNIDSCNICVW